MKNRKVYVTTFCGVAVAMNIVLGIITSALGIPLSFCLRWDWNSASRN